MKTTFKSLIVLITMAAGVQLQAQNRITVEAYNNDISYYLDLKAVLRYLVKHATSKTSNAESTITIRAFRTSTSTATAISII